MTEQISETAEPSVVGPSERPHRAEIDAWMTDPSDPEYVRPEARWCRVCLRHPSHSMHSAERIAAGR